MTAKVALITGASSGIGAAIAHKLALQNWFVYLNYRGKPDKVSKVLANIEANGGKAEAIRADITDERQLKSMFRSIGEKENKLNALVNNAGNDCGRHSALNIALDVLRQTMDINFFAAVSCMNEAQQLMKSQGGGIVNIVSEAINSGGFRLSHYVAAKSALQAYTRSAAREMAEYGIRINCVSPGIVDTQATAGISDEKVKSLPMQRMGTPEEVANAVSWLLSDEASYVAGATISVAGAK